jgi:two-component system chemotaxis sensor kinase CheA
MDVSQYLPMFLAEAREHLQELNLAVVRIEEDPTDRETVNEIFRIAHSFKGMSATMGFQHVAALTHQMEDVFELLRQRRNGLDRAAIDVLLECLDALEEAVAAIEAEGEDTLDPEPLVARLKSLVWPRGGEEAKEEGAEEAPATPDLRVTVSLARECLMPSVRAFQVLNALAGRGELVSSTPHLDEVDGFAGKELVAVVATDAGEEELRQTALAISDVDAVEVIAEAARAAERKNRDVARHKGASTVRIDAERLDELMHLMGELVVHRTRVESLAGDAKVPGLSQAMQDLTRSSQALQAMVMQVRMIPIEAVFLRLPRLVRDLSSQLGKQVDLRLSGQETELDRTVVETLGDPLVHLVRNALDHGVESPEQRTQAGKDATGVLEVSARHAGGNVVITVRDDGRGIDTARVARRAAERGLIQADAIGAVDAQHAVELLFEPGFSTVDETSDISGRGVGMDAVRAAVREHGGEVTVSSEPGRGTTAQIRLPLTLAIMSALLVEAGRLPFAIPLDRVERTLALDDFPVRSVAGRKMLMIGERAIPLLDAATALGYESAGACPYAVIVRAGDHRLALAVEQLVGQRELVTRPLPPEVAAGAALTGGAVLANGDIALIVDCDAVVPQTRFATAA